MIEGVVPADVLLPRTSRILFGCISSGRYLGGFSGLIRNASG
jgi:hypothetical protein